MRMQILPGFTLKLIRRSLRETINSRSVSPGILTQVGISALGKELLQRLRVTSFLRRRAEAKTRVLEIDVWILAFVDVGVRDSILARQRLIEFGEHSVRSLVDDTILAFEIINRCM